MKRPWAARESEKSHSTRSRTKFSDIVLWFFVFYVPLISSILAFIAFLYNVYWRQSGNVFDTVVSGIISVSLGLLVVILASDVIFAVKNRAVNVVRRITRRISLSLTGVGHAYTWVMMLLPTQRSFAGLVVRRTARPKIRSALLLIGLGTFSAFVEPEGVHWFEGLSFGCAALTFLDVALMTYRQRTGRYGDNDLEVAEAARYVITRMGQGRGPDDFDSVFEERKRKKFVNVPVDTRGWAGAR